VGRPGLDPGNGSVSKRCVDVRQRPDLLVGRERWSANVRGGALRVEIVARPLARPK
jgi:hypothetical protein